MIAIALTVHRALVNTLLTYRIHKLAVKKFNSIDLAIIPTIFSQFRKCELETRAQREILAVKIAATMKPCGM